MLSNVELRAARTAGSKERENRGLKLLVYEALRLLLLVYAAFSYLCMRP